MNDPCAPITTTAADGASITACAHGGQLLGWRPAGSDVDRLWASPLARCGPDEAIRGGVPVVFPQFSTRALADAPALPKHGFARDRPWQLELGVHKGPDGAESAAMRAQLSADPRTTALWPHSFSLTLTASARGSRLDLALEVRNDGDAPFAFAAALHTYLRVSDATEALITGLGGLEAERNADLGAEVMPTEPLIAMGPRDVALHGAVELLGGRGTAVRLLDPRYGVLELAARGFGDLVLWNPGAHHALADVPVDGAREFVCLEPAQLTPMSLAPQAVWRGEHWLVADVDHPRLNT